MGLDDDYEYVAAAGPVDATSLADAGGMTMPMDMEHPPAGEELTYEELVRAQVQQYIAEAQRYAVETDLTRRLHEWEQRVGPALTTEAARPAFDIRAYGEEMMQRLSSAGGPKAGPKRFEALAGGAPEHEVARLLLATLQLANSGNVEIQRTPDAGLSLKLLKRAAHFDGLDVAIGHIVA